MPFRRQMPRSGFRQGSLGIRRQTDWLGSADRTGVSTIAAAGVILDQSFTQAQIQALGPITIVRTIGYIALRSDQAALTEEPFGALGFMVVREQARVAGVGSLPTPIASEFDDGWFGY